MGEPGDDRAELGDIATPAELAARLAALLAATAGQPPVAGLRALERDIRGAMQEVRAAFTRTCQRHSRALLAQQHVGAVTNAEGRAERRAYAARQAREQDRQLASYAALAARVAQLRGEG